MKSNEDDVPWDPKPEDQKVDGKNLKAGLDQLERDTLRFLELIPDVKMAEVKIATNLAFPLAQEPSERALTKEDFESDNARGLLVKLGVPKELLELPRASAMNSTDESKESFKKIICRYLGAHANVQAKVSLAEGLEALDIAVKGTEGAFGAESSHLVDLNVENMMKAVSMDPRMREIQRAVLVPKFGKRFQIQNPNIPLKDLKQDNKRYLKQVSSNKFPLFGKPAIEAVIRAADDSVAHQEVEVIRELLEKEKFAFFNDNGEPLVLKAMVEEHVQNCSDCCDVQEIKKKLPKSDGEHLLHIPIELEHEILLFADRRHLGFAEAYQRIKSWVDFPDFKRKVLTNHSLICSKFFL